MNNDENTKEQKTEERTRRGEKECQRVSRVAFFRFSVGGRVIADQLHNKRETKSETGSKCLCRSDNGINGRLLRER